MPASQRKKITVSKLSLQVNKAKAEQRWSIWRAKVGVEGKDLKRIEAANLVSAAARAERICSVSQDSDGWLWVMAEGVAPASYRGAATAPPLRRVPWGAVPSYVVARLIINASAIPLDSDERNDAGRCLVAVETTKNKAVAVEVVIKKDMTLELATRTFTSRALIASLASKRGDKRELGKIADLPGYRVCSSRTLARSSDEDALVQRKVKGDKGKNLVKYAALSGSAAGLSKLGVFERIARTIAARYSEAFTLSFEKQAARCWMEVPKSSILKQKAISELSGEEVDFTPAGKSLERDAGALAEAFQNDECLDIKLGTGGAELRLCVVPDEQATDDGYEIPEGVAVQHVTQTVAQACLGTAQRTMRQALCKELLVKRDVVRGYISAFDWKALEIEELSAACAVPRRLRNGGTDVFTTCYGHMRITQGGEMSFSMHSAAEPCPDGGAERLELEIPIDDSGDPLYGTYVLAYRYRGEDVFAVISDSGLFTVPNDLSDMLDDMAAGKSVRSKKNGSLEKYLLPVLGLGSFLLDDELHYYVGSAENVNSSLPKAVRCKKVELIEGPESALVPLFDMCLVGLSRLGRPSAIPIVFKYLNEHARRHMGVAGEQLSLF